MRDASLEKDTNKRDEKNVHRLHVIMMMSSHVHAALRHQSTHSGARRSNTLVVVKSRITFHDSPSAMHRSILLCIITVTVSSANGI